MATKKNKITIIPPGSQSPLREGYKRFMVRVFEYDPQELEYRSKGYSIRFDYDGPIHVGQVKEGIEEAIEKLA